jgi:predicted nucleic acid-binding protein
LPGPLIVPAAIVAEVCYMITRYRFGSAAEAAFLRSFTEGDLVIGKPHRGGLRTHGPARRARRQFPLGGSDASLITIAERRSITTIFTTDRRHFAAVRPKHVEAFDLLP